ncbi:GLE1-like protein-domain-containing protein [Amylocarpus encephaloides]|uniref:mRNA export factor GLE1 n=1 Tax=Amylocarpus encephaloides TaxID=45428 RepID=A0A9P8C325_9HELO|nr:GLE1-like protein-domain-containing protein [Amylocarpus encephaloides]
MSRPDVEELHRQELQAAKLEHDRVRETALRELELHRLREEEAEARFVAQQEVERVRLEASCALEAVRLREAENAAKRIPVLPPRILTPPAPPPAPVPPPPVQQPVLQQPPPPPSPQQPVLPPVQKPTSTNGSLQSSHILPHTERYTQIHQKLKEMRRFVNGKLATDTALRKKFGDLRRKVNMTLGQLTYNGDARRNLRARDTIADILRESLSSNYPDFDPAQVVAVVPERNPSAKYNDDVSIMFIWLLNYFAKYIVSQLIEEASSQPLAADPIGILAVSIFGRREFSWRHQPLIDILICKLRVFCPVLWGIRGNDETEQGRTALGWKREGSNWVTQQVHGNRMTGLAAGYAALSLRNFANVKSTEIYSPWHPTHYWQTLAVILNTPTDQISSTQFLVLRSLIENYELKFMNIYGSAARAVLRVALVDFPAKAGRQSDEAVQSLIVLADKLEKETGLQLRS